MRNVNTRFSQNPANIEISRSVFDRDSSLKTTFNAGKLIPFYIDEVLPGDTFSMDTSLLCRMSTPIYPVMDNAFLDYYYFFVPNRLVWDHWKEFNGENNTSAWTQNIDYQVPSALINVEPGSLGDYFGLPITDLVAPGSMFMEVNALPFRAYQLIWNEWFRDQNLQDPILVHTSDNVSTNERDSYELMSVAKYHDYFTSCLPSPQKGDPVGVSPSGLIPVTTTDYTHLDDLYPYNTDPLYFQAIGGNTILSSNTVGLSVDPNSIGDYGHAVSASGATSDGRSSGLYPANLVVDGANLQFNVNDLRFAFALQKLYERDARGGTRYRELIKSHFGVTIPDSTVQVPEYLGGKRVPINVDQVVQMSATNDVTPQGNTAAFSKTVDKDGSFTKSFTEHGFIIGVMCVRTLHTYQQGINRMWMRKDRLDYYWPVFAHIGEQPVYDAEIKLSNYGTDSMTIEQMKDENHVFGYQEAWADYRYKPSQVTGYMRSGVPGSLDIWHYADYFDSVPNLSDEWIRETPVNIDRTLAVQSPIADQFIIDMYFNCNCSRAMPLYSIPGLIDHN